MVKVKSKYDMNGYAVAGEKGKVKDEWKEKLSGHRMRLVEFKDGGQAVFGDKAFDALLEIIK